MAKVCKKCGYTAKDTDQFCFQCGQPFEKETQEQTKQSFNETSVEGLEKPLSVKDYLIVFLIMIIPIVNIIMLLIWAFDKNGNTNRRNFARAGLIYMIICYVLGIVLTVVVVSAVAIRGGQWMQRLQYEVQDELYDHYYDDDYYYYYNNYNNSVPYDHNYHHYGSPLSYENGTWQDYFAIGI